MSFLYKREVPKVVVEQGALEDVLRCLVHTICFCRQVGDLGETQEVSCGSFHGGLSYVRIVSSNDPLDKRVGAVMNQIRRKLDAGQASFEVLVQFYKEDHIIKTSHTPTSRSVFSRAWDSVKRTLSWKEERKSAPWEEWRLRLEVARKEREIDYQKAGRYYDSGVVVQDANYYSPDRRLQPTSSSRRSQGQDFGARTRSLSRRPRHREATDGATGGHSTNACHGHSYTPSGSYCSSSHRDKRRKKKKKKRRDKQRGSKQRRRRKHRNRLTSSPSQHEYAIQVDRYDSAELCNTDSFQGNIELLHVSPDYLDPMSSPFMPSYNSGALDLLQDGGLDASSSHDHFESHSVSSQMSVSVNFCGSPETGSLLDLYAGSAGGSGVAGGAGVSGGGGGGGGGGIGGEEEFSDLEESIGVLGARSETMSISSITPTPPHSPPPPSSSVSLTSLGCTEATHPHTQVQCVGPTRTSCPDIDGTQILQTATNMRTSQSSIDLHAQPHGPIRPGTSGVSRQKASLEQKTVASHRMCGPLHEDGNGDLNMSSSVSFSWMAHSSQQSIAGRARTPMLSPVRELRAAMHSVVRQAARSMYSLPQRLRCEIKLHQPPSGLTHIFSNPPLVGLLH